MPPVATAIGTWVGTGVATALGGGFTALGVGSFVGSALYYATNTFLLNKAMSLLAKRGKSGETRGLETSYIDSTADSRVIYGEVRVGGVNMIPPVTSGDDGDMQHQVLAIASHEVGSFVEYYFDQDTLPAPGSITGASTDGEITSGKYDEHAWVRGYLGTMSQNVDYILNAAFPSQWASTARGRGWAYVALTYRWGKGKVYRGLPIVTVKVRGAKVYDPRLDSTNGGTGTHRYTDATTWTWSSNPALCWANYRIADYGYGDDPAEDINWASVATAADVCDALVADKDAGTQARYTCNGLLINSKESLLSNEAAIVDSMMGHRRFIAGKWEIIAGGWTAPEWAINKEDWLSIEKIRTVAGPEDGRVNTVHCFYVDPDRNWQRVECKPRTNTTFLSDDGGEVGEVEMEQPLCTDESEAQRKAEFLLRASRNGISLVGTLPPRFQKMRTYDTVALDFEELSWVSKTFRIAAMTFNMDGSVRVALTEEQEADWDDLDAADYDALSDATIPTVNPTKPAAVTALTGVSRAGSIAFAWDEPVVWPRDAFFRLRGALVNSYGASDAVWEGSALNTVVTRADTATLYYWMDSIGRNGSYSTFPGVGSGYPAAASLVDNQNVAPGAITRTWSAQVTSVDVTQLQTFPNPVVQKVAQVGTFTPRYTGHLLCTATGRARFYGNASGFTSTYEYGIDATGVAAATYGGSVSGTAQDEYVGIAMQKVIPCTSGTPISVWAGAAKLASGNSMSVHAMDLVVVEASR